MEKIVQSIEEKTEDLGVIVSDIERFTKNFFGAMIDDIFEVFPGYRNKDLHTWLKQ